MHDGGVCVKHLNVASAFEEHVPRLTVFGEVGTEFFYFGEWLCNQKHFYQELKCEQIEQSEFDRVYQGNTARK